MKIYRLNLETTWKTDWLLEFSIAALVLATAAREIEFAAAGMVVAVSVSVWALAFSRGTAQASGTVKIDLHLNSRKIEVGKASRGELRIRNESRSAVRVLKAAATNNSTVSVDIASSSKMLVKPRATAVLECGVRPSAIGRHPVPQFLLKITDARGLFTRDVILDVAESIEGYPVELPVGPLTPYSLYGDRPETSRKSSTGADYAGTREYSAGDELHKVEWKATARLGNLMVKEFHPETRATLIILIDASRTMFEPSYVGSKVDEALAVGLILIEDAAQSGYTAGVAVYDERELRALLKPAEAKHQLLSFWEIIFEVPELSAANQFTYHAANIRPPPVPNVRLPLNERLSYFLRLVNSKLRVIARKTGIHKAVSQFVDVGFPSVVIMLTDLQTNVELLSESITRLQAERAIIVQIGASWRFSDSLEVAYRQHESNKAIHKHLEELGLVVLDARPETLLDEIKENISTRIVYHDRLG